MKNYTYGWRLKELGYVEVTEERYTDRQKDMQKYIEVLSEAIRKAKCGWDGVRYAVMQYTDDSIEKYMVLYCEDGGDRWIPITGNSKGCNLSVLGENLW
jgi:hypothetical protein